MATATARKTDDRASLQRELGLRATIEAELRDRQKKRAEVEKQVKAGKLTPRALEAFDSPIRGLQLRLSTHGEIRQKLIASAALPLRDAYFHLVSERAVWNGRIGEAKRALHRLEPELQVAKKRYAEVCERQKNAGDSGWSEKDHEIAQREIRGLERRVAAVRDELLTAEQQLADVEERTQAAKLACIES